MPSKTTHFPEDIYQRILETVKDEQTVSSRVAELTEKGLIYEDEYE